MKRYPRLSQPSYCTTLALENYLARCDFPKKTEFHLTLATCQISQPQLINQPPVWTLPAKQKYVQPVLPCHLWRNFPCACNSQRPSNGYLPHDFVLVFSQIRWFIASLTYLYPLCHILAFSDDRWVSLYRMELHSELLRNICPSEDCRGLIISRLCGHPFRYIRLKPLSSSISTCFPVSKIIRHPAPYGYGELHDGLLQRTVSPCCSFTVNISRYGIGDIINMAVWQRRSAAWSNISGCCNDTRCKLWALTSKISHPCIWKQIIFRRCIVTRDAIFRQWEVTNVTMVVKIIPGTVQCIEYILWRGWEFGPKQELMADESRKDSCPYNWENEL